jgi:hypothetical protein
MEKLTPARFLFWALVIVVVVTLAILLWCVVPWFLIWRIVGY